MRKVIVSEFVTLDGVMEAPDKWSFQFWNEEAAKFKFDELFASDALLLGRVTYQIFADAWPSLTDEENLSAGLAPIELTKGYYINNQRDAGKT